MVRVRKRVVEERKERKMIHAEVEQILKAVESASGRAFALSVVSAICAISALGTVFVVPLPEISVLLAFVSLTAFFGAAQATREAEVAQAALRAALERFR